MVSAVCCQNSKGTLFRALPDKPLKVSSSTELICEQEVQYYNNTFLERLALQHFQCRQMPDLSGDGRQGVVVLPLQDQCQSTVNATTLFETYNMVSPFNSPISAGKLFKSLLCKSLKGRRQLEVSGSRSPDDEPGMAMPYSAFNSLSCPISAGRVNRAFWDNLLQDTVKLIRTRRHAPYKKPSAISCPNARGRLVR